MPRELVGDWSVSTLREPMGAGAKSVQVSLSVEAVDEVDRLAGHRGQSVSATLRQLIRWGMHGDGPLHPVPVPRPSYQRSTVLAEGTLRQLSTWQKQQGTRRAAILRSLVVDSLERMRAGEL